MDISINENAFPNSDARPNKQRRKKSMVWEHFTVETVTPDSVRAFCNQCRKSFAYISGSKVAGTSHLKRHIALGICPVNRVKKEKDQMISHVPPPLNGTNIPRKRCRASNGVTSTYFDGDSCSYDLAKMVIQHNYQLGIVEHFGFLKFSRSLQPQFNVPDVSLMHEQIMGIYMREKHKLVDLVNGIPGHLNLTVDLRISNKSLGYVLLTGHFTDHDWKLQRRIFSVIIAQFPESDTTFADAIAACLGDWGLENKLFTVTVDLTHANQSSRENIRNQLLMKNSLVLKGQLLVNSCYVRTLRSLVEDALGSLRNTIQKVRDSVKYVKIFDSHEERFLKLKQQLQVPSTKNLMLDDSTRWNTTYQMLVAASELKEVFLCLDTSDPDYHSTLSVEEWGQVEILCKYLKIFYDAANILTSPLYPTTNSFFDVVWKIYFELLHAAVDQDSFVSTLTRPMLDRFTKYWEDCNLVLTIAVVMDPRFKMKFVEFSFSRIYGDDAEAWIKMVYQGLHDLYHDYVMLPLPTPSIEAGSEHSVKTDERDGLASDYVMLPHPSPSIESGSEHSVKTEEQDGLLSDYVILPLPTPMVEAGGEHEHLVKTEEQDGLLSHDDGFGFDILDVSEFAHVKFEIDQYLEESVLPRVQDFDVLDWWRENRLKYPTLSKLASDVLSIPLSTVPPESVFDLGERKMDSYLSSLRPKTLHALICAKDWLQYQYVSPIETKI